MVFLQRGADTDAFLRKLAELVHGAAPGTMLTSGIRAAFLENRGKITAVAGVQPLATAGTIAKLEGTESEPSVATTTARHFLENHVLTTEAFGPFTLVIVGETAEELAACAAALEGQLTATLHGTTADLADARNLIATLEQKVGRIVINGFPTGVEVCHAMHHGGPSPATTDARFTSVGSAAIYRWARPVCYQSLPDELLPPALQNANPLGLLRLINGKPTRDAL